MKLRYKVTLIIITLIFSFISLWSDINSDSNNRDLPPASNFSCTVFNNNVNMTWDQPAQSNHMILQNDNGSATWYSELWEVGDMEAANLDLSTRNYPVTIDTLIIMLFDYMSVGTTDINLHIYETDITGAPGTEIYNTGSFAVTTFFPSFVYVDITGARVSADDAFFVAIEHLNGTQGNIPAGLMDDQTEITIGKNYYYFPGIGWEEHYDYWDGGEALGYNIIRAAVTTSSREHFILGNDKKLTEKPDHAGRGMAEAIKLPPELVTNAKNQNTYGSRALSGYNIYRNGGLIHTIINPLTTTYTDSGLPDGSYTYYVTAIYSNPAGESVPSEYDFVTIRYSNSQLKWSQPPVYNIESEYPECFWGWDEPSDYYMGPIDADDWLCETPDPITDVHWWGSYLNYESTEPPPFIPGFPNAFHIGIWTDIPAGVDLPYSHPGMMIWEWVVPREDANETYVGCDYHSYAPVVESCFEYSYNIPPDFWFFQDPGPTIYWISISAMYEAEFLYQWGCKTRPHYFMDYAVKIFFPPAPMIGMLFEMGDIILEGYDLAFELTTEAGEDEREYGDAPEASLGYPSTALISQFPTCKNSGQSGWIEHNNFGAWFGTTFDFELDGNAGNCPVFNPNQYDLDECFNDGDAGLIMPPSYTIQGTIGSEVVVPCSTATGPLELICGTAEWGTDIDIFVHNTMPGHDPYLPAYVNLLIDWNQDGIWANDPATVCPPGGSMIPEHVLVDHVVPAQYIGALSAIPSPPADFIVGPNPGYVWCRFSITEAPVNTDNWDGEGVFEDGETEDYLLYIEDITEELDYGDAPDPTYPTLSTSNGAAHLLDGITYLGAGVDSEPDGLQDPNALGDDFLDGNDDEDGVFFNTSFAPGRNVQITVTASTSGSLNSWFDFNNNGTWADTGEQIHNNLFLSAGQNVLNFIVPASAILGHTFARFRFTSYPVTSPSPMGIETDGEVEDYQIFIHHGFNNIKMDNPQYPKLSGCDIDIDYPNVIADDWLCNESGGVTDLHFWISFMSDDIPLGDPNLGIDFIHVSIHADIPADPPEHPYSLPEPASLWERDFVPADFNLSLYFENLQSWFSPPDFYLPENHNKCFLVDIPTITDPFIQMADTIYWLDISIMMTPGYEWATPGWKTTIDNWYDTGVYGMIPDGVWEPLLHPITAENMDLAFIITGSGEELDYGDAPDPNYPTWWSSDGARHAIDGVTFLGITVDVEPDGQPDPNSLGDDNDGIDDEDGVTFPAMYVGSQVLIDFNVSGGGFIDAWFDFDMNGSWLDPGEYFNIGYLAAGSHQVPVNIPASASLGLTHSRFRISTGGGLSPTGYAPDGEVEDYEIEIVEPLPEIKWEQLPDLTPLGLDVDATWDEPGVFPPHILADDFLCTTSGLITDIHVWGSWKLDILPDGDPNNVWFTLSIHSDIPDPDGPGPEWSMPGDVLWTLDLGPGMFYAELFFEGPEGWYDPVTGEYIEIGDTQCWLYNFYIPEELAFMQEGTPDNPVVYWLDLQAHTIDPEFRFGWKTSEIHWNDDGVYGIGYEPYLGPWYELRYPAMHPFMGESIDLAFRITTTPSAEELDFGDAPDPSYPTLLASDGARHTIDGITYLGAGVDVDMDGQPVPPCLGDDNDGNNDEDGIFFLNPIIPGLNANFIATASLSGLLSMWFDFYLDNDWNDPGENMLVNQPLSPGTNNLSIVVPITGAGSGWTCSRFRFSDNPSNSQTGLVINGEVEDHSLFIDEPIYLPKWVQLPKYNPESPNPEYFWGWDEMSNWETGPVIADDWLCEEQTPVTDIHWWGSYMDWDLQDPPPNMPFMFHIAIWTDVPAGGDTFFSHPGMMIWETFAETTDLNQIPVGYDFHDDFMLYPETCFRYDYQIPQESWFYQESVSTIYWLSISAVYSEPPVEHEWGWKTREHIFNDGAIRIFAPVMPTVGNEYIEGDPIEDSYLNYWDLAFVLTTTEITDSLDYGDAPDPTYPTYAANNGANHTIVPTEYLGLSIDAELDGQPTAGADGDDNDGIDDEDGITFTSALLPGHIAQVSITASIDGFIHAWIDFNADGDWDDTGEKKFFNQAVAAGVNPLAFAVPISAVPGLTTSRFRYITTSTPGLTYTGNFYGGEVEDHRVFIDSLDYGDAPESGYLYPTILAANGARHVILPGYTLGNQPNSIDHENNGQPDFAALGDDNDGNDDEDGITLSTLVPGQDAILDVTTSMSVSGYNTGYLDAWIDFNADGDWDDSGEQIANTLALSPLGFNSFFIPVPPTASPNSFTFARFRFSSTGGLNYTGIASDGEVEDYRVYISEDLGESKILNPQFPDVTSYGVDVNAEIPVILADDFLCIETGLITEIYIWTSWFNDMDSSTGDINLSIWSDVPDPDGEGPLYSMPGEMLWSKTFQPFEYFYEPILDVPEGEWWFDPQYGDTFYPADYMIWRYHFTILEEEAFYQLSDTVYWLSVQMIDDDDPENIYRFGWKTSADHWNDDAVWGLIARDMSWNELIYPDGHPLHPNSIDLSFFIKGVEFIPSPLEIYITRLSDRIRIDWTAVTGATSYNVYYSTDPYATFPTGWTFMGSTSNLYYDDGPPLPGVAKKYYRVTANN